MGYRRRSGHGAHNQDDRPPSRRRPVRHRRRSRRPVGWPRPGGSGAAGEGRGLIPRAPTAPGSNRPATGLSRSVRILYSSIATAVSRVLRLAGGSAQREGVLACAHGAGDRAELVDLEAYLVAGPQPRIGVGAVDPGQLEDAAGAYRARADDVAGAELCTP